MKALLVFLTLFDSLILIGAAPIDWPQHSIRASVLRDDTHLKIGQFLQLDRQLNKGESGWKQMRIDLPDRWRVKHVQVEQTGFAIFLDEDRVFRVSREQIGDLSFRILDGGIKAEDELKKLWEPYG